MQDSCDGCGLVFSTSTMDRFHLVVAPEVISGLWCTECLREKSKTVLRSSSTGSME